METVNDKIVLKEESMFVEKLMLYSTNVPNRLAIIAHDCRLNYQELYREIAKTEIILSDCEGEEPIGLLFGNSARLLVLFYAAAKQRKKVALLDKDVRENELYRHINVLRMRYIFMDKNKLVTFRNSNFLEEVEYYDEWNMVKVKCNSTSHIENDTYESDDFLIKITSGSESLGKYSVRTQNSLLKEITDTMDTLDLSKQNVFLCIPPISHSFGLIAGALLPLYYGKTLILENLFFPDKVIDIVNRYKVNVLFAVPFMYHLIIKRLETLSYGMPSLEFCFTAGSALNRDIYELYKRKIDAKMVNDYGSTETGALCINSDLEGHFESVGRPVEGINIEIRDEEGRIMPVGEKGEICIKSERISKHYIYPISQNEMQFHDDYYRTRDYGYIDQDGYVYIEGRLDEFYNISGKKAHEKEILFWLYKIKCIKQVVLTKSSNEIRGDVIIAYVVLNCPGVTEQDLLRECRALMPEHMVPKRIRIVDEIPMNITGKIQKKYLMWGEEHC